MARIRLPALVLLLVGLAAPAHAGSATLTGPASGLDDCDLPGIDDRCERWTASYDGSTLMTMAVSPDGSRVFTGGGRDGIVAHDTQIGEQLWEARLRGTEKGSSPDAPVYGLVVSPDGQRVFALGHDVAPDALPNANGALYNTDLIIAAYDAATGEEIWRRLLGLSGLDGTDRYESVEAAGATDVIPLTNFTGSGHANDDGIAVSPDGQRVYVTGTTHLRDRVKFSAITAQDVLAAGFDAGTGQRQWVATAGSRFGVEFGRFLEVSPDGRKLYVGGESSSCAGIICPRGDYYAAAFRAHVPGAPAKEGNLLWAAGYSGQGGENFLEGMELAPDGSLLYLAGSSEGEESDQDKDWATVALRAGNGSEAWVSRYEGPSTAVQTAAPVGHLPHTATSLAVSPTGDRVFVTGSTMLAGATMPNAPLTPHLSVYGTVAYDAGSGDQIWEEQYSKLPGGLPVTTAVGAVWTETGRDIDVSPDGATVYVVGTSNGGPSFQGRPEQATLAYDSATGDQAWIARVRAPDDHAWVDAAQDGDSVVVASFDGWDLRAYDAGGAG